MAKTDFPKCRMDSCFAYEGGYCTCLYSNNFKGGVCPFYKDKETIAIEKYKTKERLKAINATKSL